MVHAPFISAVASALRERCGVSAGDRLVVGVSGGADSVALLRALHVLAIQPHWALDLHIAHINHRLRSDADADETFVKELAESLNLSWHRRELALPGGGGNLEAAARHGRYAALAQVAMQVDADAIAVAHHADDQLETVLMRLIRGASVSGLSGMAPRRQLAGCRAALIRPMLQVDRAQVITFLREIGQAWCEDPTNADVSRWRANLRAQVLPALRELRPKAAVNASASADRLRQVARWANRRTRAAVREHITFDEATATLDRSTAKRLNAELLGSVIRLVSRRVGAPSDALTSRVIGPIADAVRDGSGEVRRFDLAGGVRINVERETVRWTRYDPAR